MSEINEEVEVDLEKVNEEMDIENNEVIEESEVDKLLAEIEELKKANAELDNKYLMAYADAQNIIKRSKKDNENLMVNQAASLFESIIPIVDNFERALKIDVKEEGITQFLKGFEMIYQQLTNALNEAGIEIIDSLGKEFDPNYHQSIGFVNDDSVASNIVVEELQKGYKYKSKIIRPAMVKINE